MSRPLTHWLLLFALDPVRGIVWEEDPRTGRDAPSMSAAASAWPIPAWNWYPSKVPGVTPEREVAVEHVRVNTDPREVSDHRAREDGVPTRLQLSQRIRWVNGEVAHSRVELRLTEGAEPR